MAHIYNVFLLLALAGIAFACGPNGGTPSTFSGGALMNGYKGEASGYIAGYPMKITYTIQMVQEHRYVPRKEPRLSSTTQKIGQKTYAGHPKIVKTDDFKDQD